MYPALSPTEKTPVMAVPVAAPTPAAVPMYGGYQAAPPQYYAVPPPPCDDHEDNVFWYALTSPLRLLTFQLVFFHLFNLVLALLAFALVVSVGSLGVGLIPLCCLGLLVLQFLLHLVRVFAECDVYLYNCIAPTKDQITVNFQVPRRGLYHRSGYRLSPSLSTLSAESILAVFYFVAIKLPLALMFSLTPLVLLLTSVACMAFPLYWDDAYASSQPMTITYTHHHRVYTLHASVAGIPVDEAHKAQIALFGVGFLYFSVLCLHGFGAILRGTTKFFTSEFFSTTGVVAQTQQPTYFYAPSAPMYAPVYDDRQQALPTSGTFARYCTKLGNMLLLVLLSLVSMSFSIGLFVVIIVGVSCGIGFLPLACVGLVVLNCLMACVKPLATLDEALFRQRQQLYEAIVS
ncbi:hypothetical protein SPRG_13531 [Saprolegnia parasitica CBS 223.65]|uniref:Sensor domain-containing protein n=1 Tax=Saprolegnia parasitica (strain CBS 223.65) TaxID=695850 RepID=A0A067BQM2_SAPPC|nr:hypothetical protein SPRG_13531 [Saprolegnia parasitica CBS 223.65]KDO20779.1 hypothetical protein SPRG_13531 [Saprolegnia parasitica CBS 223.65]|eukprot:XP_012208517.1 hypothetical protein SPRG_13531 [Saprolegnia parasitica CBS 223.65]